MTQAIATTKGTALQRQALTSQKMLELKDVASIFYASGMFTDIKSEAQAAVKIMAGQSFGFDPITSIAFVHIINGKPTLGAKLQAALIKSSGIYEYKVTEHTDKACTIQFYKFNGSEWKALNLPIRYTIEEAQTAGVTANPTWKKHPKAMLFASCIRQGMTRCTPDLIRAGNTVSHNYAAVSGALDSVPELAEMDVKDEVVAETEAVDAEPVTAEESNRADMETYVFDLLKEVTGGDASALKRTMKGRVVANMTDEDLQLFIGELEEATTN